MEVNESIASLIRASLNDSSAMEKLYQGDKDTFTGTFDALYPSIKHIPLAEFWHERLHFKHDEINWGGRSTLLVVVLLSLFTWFFASFQTLFHSDPELFYQKHIGFIIFCSPTAYFLWLKKPGLTQIIGIAFVWIIGFLFINWGFEKISSDTFILTCIHLPLLLTATFGLSFTGNAWASFKVRVLFLKFFADLLIISGLLLLAFGALSAISINLFSSIGINIADFYGQHIVVWIIAPLPVIASFILTSNPHIIQKIAPLIARLFTPLVFLFLLAFLLFFFLGDQRIFDDRIFLLQLNAVLIGVLALIFFSISTDQKRVRNQFRDAMLLLLSVTTIIVNICVLSVIAYRIIEYGLSPNRMAVLGGNIVIFIHLVLTASQLARVVFWKEEFNTVQAQIARYLPIYVIWLSIVALLFPWIFSFA